MVKKTVTQALILLICVALSLTALAQPTQFTYQGYLDDNGSPANGNYDFEFTVFGVVSGGAPVGSTVTLPNILVSDGVFSVLINSGTVFDSGANRFLEIGVRPAGGGAYTILNPRQPVSSAPYSIRSKSSNTASTALDAAQLGGIAADQYIRNGAGFEGGNFFVTGEGSANIFDAGAQFNLFGERYMHKSGGVGNLFVGFHSGDSIENTGQYNSVFGYESGEANTTATKNSFFGARAGKATLTASNNAFFGNEAGMTNTEGGLNAFFGSDAGRLNLDGGSNAFFGYAAGGENESGEFNSFVGATAGFKNTSGNSNTFVGWRAGETNTTGNSNTLVGRNADVGATNLVFATAIGANAEVSASNTVQLGRANGNDTVVIPGLGSAGATSLCQNASNEISTCSSSQRYKSNIKDFPSGLDLIKKLQPVSFIWTNSGMADIGLLAEAVAEVEPLLTTTKDGEIEGVKYDRVGVVLVNAVKEQQVKIEELKAIVCELKPEANLCKDN